MSQYIKSVAVFCGSRPGNDPVYLEMAAQLGRELAGRNIRVIYGGGDSGLMGAVSKAAHDAGGKVLGFTTYFFDQAQGATFGEKVLVNNMFERKGGMLEEVDAAICLAGGFGTLDEWGDTACMSDISHHNAPDSAIIPSVLLNYGGFYDGLKTQFQTCANAGFLGKGWENLCYFEPDIESVMDRLAILDDLGPRFMKDFKTANKTTNLQPSVLENGRS